MSVITITCNTCGESTAGSVAETIAWDKTHQQGHNSVQAVPMQAHPMLSSINDPFTAIENMMAFNSRDWAQNKSDAWLWSIVHGWDQEIPEDDETPADAATLEVAEKHNWNQAQIETQRSLHQMWKDAKQAYLDQHSQIAKIKADALHTAAIDLAKLQRYPDSPTADASVALRNEATANAAAWLHSRAEAFTNLLLGPECLANKHRSCDGRAFDLDIDEQAPCQCNCHP